MKNITSSKHSARFVTVSERCQSFMCKYELGWSNNGVNVFLTSYAFPTKDIFIDYKAYLAGKVIAE